MFLLDVILNFRTGYVDDSSAKPVVELSPRLIARRYIRSYFTLDLLSSLPLDYIITALASVQYSQASILKVRSQGLAWPPRFDGPTFPNQPQLVLLDALPNLII